MGSENPFLGSSENGAFDPCGVFGYRPKWRNPDLTRFRVETLLKIVQSSSQDVGWGSQADGLDGPPGLPGREVEGIETDVKVVEELNFPASAAIVRPEARVPFDYRGETRTATREHDTFSGKRTHAYGARARFSSPTVLLTKLQGILPLKALPLRRHNSSDAAFSSLVSGSPKSKKRSGSKLPADGGDASSSSSGAEDTTSAPPAREDTGSLRPAPRSARSRSASENLRSQNDARRPWVFLRDPTKKSHYVMLLQPSGPGRGVGGFGKGGAVAEQGPWSVTRSGDSRSQGLVSLRMTVVESDLLYSILRLCLTPKNAHKLGCVSQRFAAVVRHLIRDQIVVRPCTFLTQKRLYLSEENRRRAEEVFEEKFGKKGSPFGQERQAFGKKGWSFGEKAEADITTNTNSNSNTSTSKGRVLFFHSLKLKTTLIPVGRFAKHAFFQQMAYIAVDRGEKQSEEGLLQIMVLAPYQLESCAEPEFASVQDAF